MKKLSVALAGAEIGLIATTTTVLYMASRELWITFVGVAGVAFALVLGGRFVLTRREIAHGPTVGVGTVCAVGRVESRIDVESETDVESTDADGARQILIQVTGVHGEEFIGRLIHHDGDLDLSILRPGLVILVAFDPAAPEQLSLPDDALAVRATCLRPS